MDSIENGATIRIGKQRNYNDPQDLSKVTSKHLTYSLKIDKKTVVICPYAGPEKDFDYTEAAKEIVEKMDIKNIENYVVFPDERLEIPNHKWVSHDVDYIGNQAEAIFRNSLKKLIGKPALNDFCGGFPQSNLD